MSNVKRTTRNRTTVKEIKSNPAKEGFDFGKIIIVENTFLKVVKLFSPHSYINITRNANPNVKVGDNIVASGYIAQKGKTTYWKDGKLFYHDSTGLFCNTFQVVDGETLKILNKGFAMGLRGEELKLFYFEQSK